MGSAIARGRPNPRVLARGVAICALLFATSACPPRDVSVTITSTGTSALISACGSSNTCLRPSLGAASPFTNQQTRSQQYEGCACSLPDHPTLAWDQTLQARLFLLLPGQGFAVKDSSKCMTFAPCTDAGAGSTDDCLADRLNQQLDGAMPGGLSSDGLTNSSQALLLLALYQPSSNDQSCALDTLVACAGLAPPLGGGAYDISCASCQGGRSTLGPDNGPCPNDPSDAGVCFYRYCESLLSDNGYL